MRSYGQFCPIAQAAALFCERWTPLLIRDLGGGACRFSELQRSLPQLSPTLLSRRLKDLQQVGVVERRQAGRAATYHLTEAGRELMPLVEGLGVWARRWGTRELDDDEVDLGALLGSMESRVQASVWGCDRSVVRFTFRDLAPSEQHAWFVGQGARTERHHTDPGLDVNLALSSTLRDAIHVWRGDVALPCALDSGRLEAEGPAAWVARLGDWLNLHPMTAIPSMRQG